MTAQLIGIMKVNFTNSEGEQITGNNLFVAFKDENVRGARTEKFYVRGDISLPEVKIQDMIELEFNHKGKIISLSKKA
ncbi:hypothetical protein RZO55_06390 [Clostridium boliviensis]|uniref:Uncharacterized protein n=1 Tax=Clostridium boliviensis TaxID=318465 RepID=A0ABU4GJT9_9CLOT|nr:hypothetical protein [Clostridium boliviensis]MDW2797203.1 hypothetical protein [Clostridium boliviensis]